MSHAALIDDRALSWLAALDPALPPLAGLLPRTMPDRPWKLHDARWSPGEGCSLTFRAPAPSGTTTFMSARADTTDWTVHDYRDDPALPGLAAASDAGLVAARLGELLDRPVLDCVVEPVRYRPGARCVLRYDVRTSTGPVTLFAKVFSTDRFVEVAPLVLALTAPNGRDGLSSTLWPEWQALVTPAVPGRSVSHVLGDAHVPATERARLAHRLGGVLAGFHAHDHLAAPAWTAAGQVASLVATAQAVRSADPRLGARVAAVLDALASTPPAPGREVLGHGGFRAGQVVLADSGDLVVLDTDGACRSDPARDLATALAHLRWQGIRLPSQRSTLRGAEQSFLAGYESAAGALDPDALLWWRAAGLLQVVVRRFRRLEVASWPLVPALLDAATGALVTRTASVAATDLLSTTEMSLVLRLALNGTAQLPHAVAVESATKLTTTPGRRAVVEYQVRGIDGARPVAVIGKTFTEPARARLLHDHLRLLHDGPFHEGELRVPQPLGLVPEHRLVLYRRSGGRPLSEVTDRARLEDGVRRAARWLARLHTSAVPLPRVWDLARERVSTRRWAAIAARREPELAARARALADGWAEPVVASRAVHSVPIHKDFHPGHVLVDEALHVIDLDEARVGDPAFDLAHFGCYLELIAHVDGPGLVDTFLAEYVAATGWRDPGSYTAFQTYTWLKITKQCVVGSGPFRTGTPAERAAWADLALTKGEACLDG